MRDDAVSGPSSPAGATPIPPVLTERSAPPTARPEDAVQPLPPYFAGAEPGGDPEVPEAVPAPAAPVFAGTGAGAAPEPGPVPQGEEELDEFPLDPFFVPEDGHVPTAAPMPEPTFTAPPAADPALTAAGEEASGPAWDAAAAPPAEGGAAAGRPEQRSVSPRPAPDDEEVRPQADTRDSAPEAPEPAGAPPAEPAAATAGTVASPPPIVDLAERLERLARLLRTEGATALDVGLAGADRLDVLLRGILAGYLAGRE